MSDLRDIAVAYAERGWPVHPLQPNSKVPSSAHGCKDATLDVERIAQWWATHPCDNIGLATGHGFDVLDIDDFDVASETLHDLWAAAGSLGGFLADGDEVGPVVHTPSGGLHLYVAVTGFPNNAKRIAGCDWRGVGGYVVGAGSVLGDGGWAWDEHHGADTVIPAAPTWLLEALAPRRARPAAHLPLRPQRAHRRGSDRTRVRKTVDGLVRAVLTSTEGCRNDTFNWACFRLGEHMAAGELEAWEATSAVDALFAAARYVGLDDREIERTLASGLRGAGA